MIGKVSASKGQHCPFHSVVRAPNLMAAHQKWPVWAPSPFPPGPDVDGTFAFPELVALVSASRVMRRALAPTLQLLPMGPGYPPSPKATLLQVPGSQENTSGFFITCHISAKLPISENITHRKVQDPGNQSAFYFTVHSYKFLHGQDNQVTFRSALLVTKLYNYPGFKNKMG